MLGYSCALMLFCGLTLGKVVMNTELDAEWNQYKKSYNKTYSEKDETLRRQIWEENLRYIEQHNEQADKGKHTYWLGMNEYGDMSNEEFNKYMHGFRMAESTESYSGHIFIPDPKILNDPQDTVDWREKGYVVPEIGNQLQCGSCWAFTATGSLEGQHAKKTGKLVSLSEQNLMDCSRKEGNNGCEGGQMTYSYVYVKKNNGIDTEASYPYVAKEGDCKFKRENVGATDIGFFQIKKDSEKDLQAAVQSMGPIGNAIDGTQPSFQLYKSGVYSDPNCSNTTINHSLLIVGYGTDSKGQEYWTCKNSWGVSWGNKGYVLIARNKNNMCGIAATASYPIV